MAGLVPAIHVVAPPRASHEWGGSPTAWMAGTSPAMTKEVASASDFAPNCKKQIRVRRQVISIAWAPISVPIAVASGAASASGGRGSAGGGADAGPGAGRLSP